MCIYRYGGTSTAMAAQVWLGKLKVKIENFLFSWQSLYRCVKKMYQYLAVIKKIELTIKKQHIIIVGIISAVVFTTQFSCKKKEVTTIKTPTPIAFATPNGFPPVQYNFTLNPLTEEGFALGKKIFYDPKLSSDGQVACANCHQQFAAFVQYDHDFAHGVNSQHTLRNPQPLFNLAWHNSFTWDGGVNNIEVQPLIPFEHPKEMNLPMQQVIQKINEDANYKHMYKNAFGDETVNSQRTLKALSQFMLMLVSNNSKYDKVKRGEASFTPLENTGYLAFQSKCNSCHAEPLFTDLSYRSTGITIDPNLKDKGRMLITGNVQDSIKFKVPSLRNAELTFPYTHDGRYYSLDRMIDHYRFDVVNDFNTDALVRNKISINATEKAGLIAFIKTLTDTTFTKNPRFAER
jgi:cytochrome c peroxidase